MKKAIILLVIVGLGVGAYFGYYGVQRWKINKDLLLLCNPKTTDDSDLELYRKKLCPFFEEAASSSRTYTEFHEKLSDTIPNDDRVKPIIQEYKKRKEQREQEKTNL